MLASHRISISLLAACCVFATATVVVGVAPDGTGNDAHKSPLVAELETETGPGKQIEGAGDFFDPGAGDALAQRNANDGTLPGRASVVEDQLLHNISGSSGWSTSPFYATVESVFLNRDNDSFTQPLVIDVNSGSTLFSTADLDFDYEPGVRATIGLCRPACSRCSAWEFTYLGVSDWDASSSTIGNDNLAVPGDLGFAVNGFTLAESISAEYGSQLNSVEANCIKCIYEHCCCNGYRRADWFAGFRYLSLDESLSLLGQNQNVAAANYNVDTSNNLYGAQIGSRVRTYQGCFGWELLSKAGVFTNDASQRQSIVDELGVNDFAVRNASGSGGDSAFVGELGISVLARLSSTCGLRGGYNLLWVQGIALAPDQLDFTDTASSGTGLHSSGGGFLHGFNVGLEFGW